MIDQEIWQRDTVFSSPHELLFLSSVEPFLGGDFYEFEVGTCHGLWRATEHSYILAIVNDEPGNGHLDDVLAWFEHSCRRDEKRLRVLEVLNERFKNHLIEKRGFVEDGLGGLIKNYLRQ